MDKNNGIRWGWLKFMYIYTYIIGDLISIPFPYVFAKQPE